MRKGVVDVGIYNNTVGELILGEVATLGGCASWLLIATILQLPVSTTHSIVGATLGFTIVCKGLKGVQWMVLIKIGGISIQEKKYQHFSCFLVYFSRVQWTHVCRSLSYC